MIGALLGSLFGVILVGWFAFERQRDVYEQMVALITADRDIARSEVKVFRTLLFPGLAKMEAAKQAMDEIGPKPQPASNVQPFRRNKRTPFRHYFKEMMKLHNTKQTATDRLAAALEAQKPEEKKNA